MAYTSGSSRRPQQQSRPQQQTANQQRAPRQDGPTVAGAGNQAPAVISHKQKLFEKFGDKFGIDQELLVQTLKATCFRGQKADAPPITNEQLIALLIVADQYGLNPFTKEIYAYPDKGGGIVPVVSVDGWIRIINEHPQFNGMEIRTPDEMVSDTSTRKFTHKPCWEWIEVTIHRKDREFNQPIVEFFDEVYRPSINAKNQQQEWYEVATPWQTHTKRMMRHKAIIQAGRVTFGFAGIYDEDEAQRIIESDDPRVINHEPIRATSGNDAAKDALRRGKDATPPSTPKATPQPTPQAQRAQPTPKANPAQTPTRQQTDINKAPHEPWDSPADDPGPAGEEGTAEDFQNEAIAELNAATTLEELRGKWGEICDRYEENGVDSPPIEVEAAYRFRKEEMGGK